MAIMISKPSANLHSNSAFQAANVLRAWLRSDETAFRSELMRTLELCSMPATAAEEEKLELLQAVAGSLRETPLDSVCQSTVHLCLDLLVHLAGQSWTDPTLCSPGLEATH